MATRSVRTPDGKVRTAHISTSDGSGGYVYFRGHRVYGTLSAYNTLFIPRGKWAHLLTPFTHIVAPQPQEAALV